MNNLDDRECWHNGQNRLRLEKVSHLPISMQEKQNKKLSTALADLIRKAKYNQITQEKFYQLELYFLQSTSLSVLFDRLLNDLGTKLELELVELQLVDNNGDVQQLVKDIYVQLDHQNLQYLKNPQPLNELTPKPLTTSLNIQLSEFIARRYSLLSERTKLLGALIWVAIINNVLFRG